MTPPDGNSYGTPGANRKTHAASEDAGKLKCPSAKNLKPPFQLGSLRFHGGTSDLPSWSGISSGKTPAEKGRLHGYRRNIRGSSATKAPLDRKLQSPFSTFSPRKPITLLLAANAAVSPRCQTTPDDQTGMESSLIIPTLHLDPGGGSIEDRGRSCCRGHN